MFASSVTTGLNCRNKRLRIRMTWRKVRFPPPKVEHVLTARADAGFHADFPMDFLSEQWDGLQSMIKLRLRGLFTHPDETELLDEIWAPTYVSLAIRIRQMASRNSRVLCRQETSSLVRDLVGESEWIMEGARGLWGDIPESDNYLPGMR